MRRAILPWLVAFGIAVAAGTVTIVALNATVFGAGGFVRVYLDAVARGDAASALELPGVGHPGEGVSDALLTDDALAGLREVRELADVNEDGVHRITVAWESPEGGGETTFRVERIGTRFGLFPEWGFAVSPLDTVSLTVLHDRRFMVNGMAADTGLVANTARDYSVLAPGSYRFTHDTEFLSADPVVILIDQGEGPVEATLDVQPTALFAERVSVEVAAHLDECATQTVLFPSGCPIGQAIPNRVVGAPVWSMVEYPAITLQPGVDFGTWQTVRVPATAHLVVDVQSLFDGSISTFDQDVPFQVSYLVSIVGEHQLRIEAQY